jgi:hypothetical protein
LAEATFYVTISYFPYIATPAKGRPLTPPVEYVTETNLNVCCFGQFHHQLSLTLQEDVSVTRVDFEINTSIGNPPPSGLIILLTKYQPEYNINQYIVGKNYKVKNSY